jgi:hypothetical protein
MESMKKLKEESNETHKHYYTSYNKKTKLKHNISVLSLPMRILKISKNQGFN